MSKDEVLALLASFPKLTQSGTQHTTVEDDNVRYVYQPLEELYVVLITNRQSNILQDIDTLRLLSQTVSSMVRVADEREILTRSFDILSAFDEVINLGYRENLSLSQIRTFLEMESHEEKIQEIIERNKELEAAEERKKKAKQLEMQRREAARRPNPSSVSGFGSSGGYSSPQTGGYTAPAPKPASETIYDYPETTTKKASRPLRGKGLQLGKKKPLGGGLGDTPEDSPLMALPQQEEPAPAASHYFDSPAAPASTNEGIEVTVSESIAATLGRDGSVKSSLVKGNVQLRIGTPEMAKIKILTRASGQGAQFQTNPNIDKQQFTKNKTLALRDASKSFPSNNQQVEVMRWKITGKADDNRLVPLTFNCWFSQQNGSFFEVTIEYEVNSSFTETLKNVTVSIPLATTNVHVNDESSDAYTIFDDRLEWIIPEINSQAETASGSFEFLAEADSEDDFFPIPVSFQVEDSLTTYGDVDIEDVVLAADESSLKFEKNTVVVSENYTIE